MMLAEPFTLKNQDHLSISLEQFKGKWVILYFYPKDCTPGCTTEAADFSRLQSQASDVVILGVSPDFVESHQKFIEKEGLSITLLSDPEKIVLRKYGAWGLKKNYGKECEGVIRSTFLINPDGKVVSSWKNVQAKGHAEKVFEALMREQGEKKSSDKPGKN